MYIQNKHFLYQVELFQWHSHWCKGELTYSTFPTELGGSLGGNVVHTLLMETQNFIWKMNRIGHSTFQLILTQVYNVRDVVILSNSKFWLISVSNQTCFCFTLFFKRSETLKLVWEWVRCTSGDCPLGRESTHPTSDFITVQFDDIVIRTPVSRWFVLYEFLTEGALVQPLIRSLSRLGLAIGEKQAREICKVLCKAINHFQKLQDSELWKDLQSKFPEGLSLVFDGR